MKESNAHTLIPTNSSKKKSTTKIQAIVTSELQMSDGEIIDTYLGLWEIEETFRITKGTL